MLPENRQVVAAWMAFQLRQHSKLQAGLQQTAARLAALASQTAPGWPGTVVAIWPHRVYPAEDSERELLFAAIDRLLDDSQGNDVVRIWNVLLQRGIIAGSKWTEQAVLVNSRFRSSPYNAGLDWRLREGNTQLDSESGEFNHSAGRQPAGNESVCRPEVRTVLLLRDDPRASPMREAWRGRFEIERESV